MSVRCEVGTITVPGSSGDVTVTLTNFDASNPLKAVLFFGNNKTAADGSVRTNTRDMVGAADGTTQGVASYTNQDNVGTSVARRRHSFSSCIVAITNDGSYLAEGAVTDWQDDEFTVTFTVTTGGQVISWLAIGGTSITASVVNWDEPETDESSPKTINVGFTPECIINFGSGILTGTATPDAVTGTGHALLSFAGRLGSSRIGMGVASDHNTANSTVFRVMDNQDGFTDLIGAVNGAVDLSIVSNGFTATPNPDSNLSNASFQHTALCILGGELRYFETNSPTSVSNVDLDIGVDVDAKGVLCWTTGLTKTFDGSSNRWHFSCTDFTNTFSRGHGDIDNLTTMTNYSWWDDDIFLRTYLDASSTGFEADLSQPDEETVRLEWSVVNANARPLGVIVFCESTVAEVIEEDCENTFSWDSAVTEDGAHRFIENSFSWTQTLVTAGYNLPVANVFSWTQDAEHNFIYLDVSNEFSFESVSGQDWDINILQYIGLVGPRTVKNTTNSLTLSSTVVVGINEDCENTFSLTDEILRAYTAENFFNLTITVGAAQEEDIFQDLDLGDSISAAATEFGRDETNNIIKQNVSFSISGACLEKEYAPQIGESDDDTYDEISATPPTLTADTVTFTYPVVAPTHTLNLKNPTFQNTDDLRFTVVDRETRGGDRIIYSDPKWGKTEVLSMTFERICDPDTDDLVNFINTSLGKEVGFRDWEGRDWTGVIVAPRTEIAQTLGGYKVTIVFQGALA